MPTKTVKMPRLHPGQKEIEQSPARFKTLACGRRFGKTTLAESELSHRAIKGLYTAYFAPSYKMTTQTFRELSWLLRDVTTKANKNEGRIELLTGGWIDFWSLSTMSAESVRGRKYHFIVIDEAAMIPVLLQYWDEVMQPLLVDYRGGAFFCSTPRGRNDFYTVYQRGLEGKHKDYASWNFPTVANPIISPDEVERARQTTVERSFRQEYLAEFVEDAGSVFRHVAVISTAQPASGRVRPHRIVMGVDWGRDMDFTAISIMDATTGVQLYTDRFNQVGWAVQRGRIKALAEQFEVEFILAERNAIGDVNIEALQAEGLPVEPFMTTYASKMALIDGLALAIERQEITLLADPIQTHELQAYTMERTAAGNYVYGAPHGGHDDTVMALALSYQAVQLGSRSPALVQAAVRW